MFLKEQKTLIRNQAIEKRKNLEPALKAKYDKLLCHKLLSIIESLKPKVIHTFLPIKNEIDIYPVIKELLQNEIEIICPEVIKKRKLQNLKLNSLYELENGIFDTKYPANSEIYTGDYDLIIVPGLAFDKAGNRIGYGAGYYDNFLCNYPKVKKIGLCYNFQFFENIPIENHDIRVDLVLTN